LQQNLQTRLSYSWQGQLSEYITALAFSPLDRFWAGSSAAGEIVTIDRSGEIAHLQSADGRAIADLKYSDDGRWLAAGGEAGVVKFWSLDNQPQLTGTVSVPSWVEGMTWHPMTPQIAVSSGNHIGIWDAPTQAKIAHLIFAPSSVFDLAWHPSGEYLAVAGYRGVQIWAQDDWTTPLVTLPVATASIKIGWSVEGSYLAAANLDRTISIWDLEQPEDPWIFQGCPGKIRQLVWSQANLQPFLAVATGTEMALWEFSNANWTGKLLSGHEDAVTAIAIHPHYPLIASAARDGEICLWGTDGSVIQVLEVPEPIGRFTNLGWNATGSLLVAGDENGRLVIFYVLE
jgi:WD40 repeat protein